MEKQTEQTFEEVLGETSENAAMVSTRAWARYMQFLTEWRDEAFEEFVGCQSSDINIERGLKQRWLQREAVVRGSTAWAEDAVKTRDNMIEQMKRELQNA